MRSSPSPAPAHAVAVRVADCVPVLLADPMTGRVAAVHAGWRGVVADVIGTAVRRLAVARSHGREAGSSSSRDAGGFLAAIGPCIGPCCFEVGVDVGETIARATTTNSIARRDEARGKVFVDLRAAVRAQLRALGLADDVDRGRPSIARAPAARVATRSASTRTVATATRAVASSASSSRADRGAIAVSSSVAWPRWPRPCIPSPHEVGPRTREPGRHRQARTGRRRRRPGLLGLIPLVLRFRGGWVIALLIVGFVLVGGLGGLGGIFGGGSGDTTTTSAPLAGHKTDDKKAQFVAFVLDDTQNAWRQEFAKRGKTYRNAKLVMFTGATQTACGGGQAAQGPFYCPSDERVYIDLSFYNELEQRFGAKGDFAQAYVIAHEIGHHVQKQLGISDKVA